MTAEPIAAKGNATDEFEMDPIIATGRVTGTNTITIYWSTIWGSPAIGIYAFAYLVTG